MKTVALIIGGAQGVWEELAEAIEFLKGRSFIIVAVNDAGHLYEGQIDAWATLHPEFVNDWRAARREAGGNNDYRMIVHANRRALFDVEVVPQTWHASSGIYAAQVAIDALGCAGAILCGVPLDPERGHIAADGEWTEFPMYRPGVVKAHAAGAPIRSMSGWSASVLGQPDKAWLKALGVSRTRKPRPRQPEEATMRVKMTRTTNFVPADERRITVKYLADGEYTVRRSWGERLIADGDAVEIDAPAREDDAQAG